jgi:hypothetical protein
MRTRDGLREIHAMFIAAILAPIIVAPEAIAAAIVVFAAHLGYFSHGTALANRFVNRAAGASAQSNKDAAAAAVRIPHRTAARAAGSLGHSDVVAEVSIGP